MRSPTRRTAVAALGVLAVALAAGAVAFLPGQQQQTGARTGSALTAVVTSSGGNTTFTQGPGTAISAPACAGSTETYGNITWTVSRCVSYGFPSALLKNATLDSREVLPFIRTAYEYHLVYFAFSRTNANLMYAVLNVTGSQVVTGNYTTGYQVSYVGDKLLNVTVLQVVPSHFKVAHVSAYALPDRSGSVAYTVQEQQAISVALSDPKVRSLMVEPPYYVEFVGSSGNATVTNSYFIQLYQVDGTGIVGAFVSTSLQTVVKAYTQERLSAECWPDGIVITDPWAAADFKGCTA